MKETANLTPQLRPCAEATSTTAIPDGGDGLGCVQRRGIWPSGLEHEQHSCLGLARTPTLTLTSSLESSPDHGLLGQRVLCV